MRAILVQLLVILAFGVAWLAAVDVAAAKPYTTRNGPIESLRTKARLVKTAPEAVVFRLNELKSTERERLLVLGSSNVMYMLRPHELQLALSGWDAHNIAIPSSNLVEAEKQFRLALSMSDSETVEQTIFVLGLFYGQFAPTRTLSGWWGRTRTSPLENELSRYGLYRRKENGEYAPLMGNTFPRLTKELQRAALFVRRVKSDTEGFFAKQQKDGKTDWKLYSRRSYAYNLLGKLPNEKTKRGELKKRRGQMGSSEEHDPAQLEALERIVTLAQERGAKLVITELALPQWHRDKSRHYGWYQKHLRPKVAKLAEQDGVEFIDMHDALSDSDFADSTHVLHKSSSKFSRAFARQLEANDLVN